jgi:biotin carboxyl carrier protein
MEDPRNQPDPSTVPTEEIELSQVEAARQEAQQPKKPRMSTRNRILFYVVAWLIVLMPFLFWRATWFGRPLSDAEMSEYLRDEQKPRHIQHALVQIGEQMDKHQPGVAQWYPELVRLSTHPVEEIRNTDAWVMGKDTSRPEFHQALLKMLGDPSEMVRGNAALSLVRFGDGSGRAQIAEMLEPTTVTAPVAGTVTAAARSGEPIQHGTLLVRLEEGGQVTEVRSPITGTVKSVVATPGGRVTAGDKLAVVAPGTDQVWEALRALYLVGTVDDLPYITPYERDVPNLPERIVQQARATEQAIRERAGR